MSKSGRCFYTTERTDYGKSLGTYICFFTQEECKNPKMYKECEIWKKNKGTVIAL